MRWELRRWGGRSQSGGSNNTNKYERNETVLQTMTDSFKVFLYWTFSSNVIYLMFFSTHVAMKDFIFCTSIKVLEMKTHAGFSLQRTC